MASVPTPDEARQIVLDALADLPSGPRGEEVLSVLLAKAWDEGAEADADVWCLYAVPCGSCANCTGPALVNPYTQGAGQ